MDFDKIAQEAFVDELNKMGYMVEKPQSKASDVFGVVAKGGYGGALGALAGTVAGGTAGTGIGAAIGALSHKRGRIAAALLTGGRRPNTGIGALIGGLSGAGLGAVGGGVGGYIKGVQSGINDATYRRIIESNK